MIKIMPAFVFGLCVGCASVGQLEDIKLGMSRSEVEDTLGLPDAKKETPTTLESTYDLVLANKFWQVVLTYPTIGIVYLVDRRHTLKFENDHLVSIESEKSGGGSAGAAALRSIGQSLQNQPKQTNCTSLVNGPIVTTQCD